MPQADGKPAVYGGGVEDEAMMTMGLVGYGGMEGDGEYVTTLGFYGATVVTAGETLATLGMAADDGTEAGGAYLTTLGAAE